MYTIFLILIVLVAVLLSVVILLQSGKGGGLAATFGGASSSTDSFIGGRQAANLLTKLSWIGGGVFLGLALLLSVLSARDSGPAESILQQETGTQVPQSPSSVLESESRRGQPDAGEPGPGETGGGDGPLRVAPTGGDSTGGS